MTRAATPAWLATFVALVLLSQVLAGASAPSAPRADEAEVLGRTGYAYLGGLRTYAAAALWNRLDPIFHGYYRETPTDEQKYMMPTIYMVQALDPQLEQPYYLGAFVLASQGDFGQAIDLAERGVENNPTSGLMRGNLVQILMMQDPEENLAAIEREAAIGLSEEMDWTTPEDYYESMAIFRSVYRRIGDAVTEQKIQAAMDGFSAQVDVGDHDHDRDGVQDH